MGRKKGKKREAKKKGKPNTKKGEIATRLSSRANLQLDTAFLACPACLASLACLLFMCV